MKRGEDKTGTQLVRGLAGRCLGLYLWELGERSVRSIIGMTESTWKRTAVRHALMTVLKLIRVLVESFQTKKRVV